LLGRGRVDADRIEQRLDRAAVVATTRIFTGT
jgi:hypothetical protein